MKRISRLLAVAALGLTALLPGCVVGHHGHMAWLAPPLVAAAIIASRPGEVWVEGHWDWVDGQWSWSRGYWMAERPGFVWIQGGWSRDRGRHEWRPGRWHDPRVEVRDHRR
jgi:hypothetical protein